MRVPFGLSAAALLVLGTAAAAPPPRLPIAIEVLPLDAATHGDSRYVQGLIDSAGRPSAWFEYQPSQIEPGSLERCADGTLSGAVPCVRYQLSKQNLREVRPVHVVVVIGEGPLPSVRCVGIGGEDHRAEVQALTVNPASLRYAGNAQYNEDLGAFAGCITAAGAESGW